MSLGSGVDLDERLLDDGWEGIEEGRELWDI